ncbi:MAG: DUF4916 domain-containing protein [bacterium]|nr:DUF4916 domain-containing protein [bacterium]
MSEIPENYSEEQLAAELRRRGLFTKDGLVKLPIYEMGVEILPVVCADVIPVKKDGGLIKVGVILRATGPESGKLAVIGGRVRRDQKISDAISKHLKTDLAISQWTFHPDNSEEHPFYVQQYFQRSNSNDKFGYDPTKHAIAMTYLIEIEGEPKPKNEANSFVWVTEAEIPEVTAYNHGQVMKQAFEFIERR